MQPQNISVKKTKVDHTHKERHPTELHTENSNSKLKILWLIQLNTDLTPSDSIKTTLKATEIKHT
jgi:hypothetical protein